MEKLSMKTMDIGFQTAGNVKAAQQTADVSGDYDFRKMLPPNHLSLNVPHILLSPSTRCLSLIITLVFILSSAGLQYRCPIQKDYNTGVTNFGSLHLCTENGNLVYLCSR